MITIKNDALIKAVKNHDKGETAVAYQAGSSPNSLKKLLDGGTDFNVSTAKSVADFLNLDIHIEYVPRKAETAKA